jgi:DNA-3-methyladenine glycosylase
MEKGKKPAKDSKKDSPREAVPKQSTLFASFAKKKDESKTDANAAVIEEETMVEKTPYKRLGKEFFQDDVVSLSRKLLGKIIRRNVDGQILRARIVETEAYKAPEDKGCHAYNNKRTERTKAFWCDAGCWYVYTIYMKTNLCLNIVAADPNSPEAVLIRAGEPIEGVGQMQTFRNMQGKNKPAEIRNLTNGPGKLGQALNIGLEYSCRDFCEKGFEDAYIEEETGYQLANEQVVVTTRINIDYAEEWKDKPWRFYIKGNKFVSVLAKEDS